MLSQEVTEQENLTETLSETSNVENYSEDNLINKYIQDSENTTKNIEEQQEGMLNKYALVLTSIKGIGVKTFSYIIFFS